MARGFRMGGSFGGGQTQAYLAPINTLALTSPSDNSADTSTKRTFVRNSYVKGITVANGYNSNTITSISISGNQISFTSTGSGWAVGFVLNSNVREGVTYRINGQVVSGGTSSLPISAMFYQADGTYISYVLGTDFTVPSGTAYVVVLIRGGSGNNVFTLNGVTKV